MDEEEPLESEDEDALNVVAGNEWLHSTPSEK